MADIPLTPIAVELSDPVFNAIATWSFASDFVSRIFSSDIPQRIKFGNAWIWAYLDPQESIVGFGTRDLCYDCSQFTNGNLHTYVPLLAVNPDVQGRGHGRSIVNHLVAKAASLVAQTGIHPVLFLDVYEDSKAAIGLYTKCSFVTLNGPIVDPANGKKFFVMAKRVSA